MLSFNEFVQSRPMLARPAKNLATAMQECKWAENKYDGMRIWLVRYEDGEWDVLARSLKSYKGIMPHMDQIAQNLPKGTILDGEAVLFKDGAKGMLTSGGHEIEVEMPNFRLSMSIMRSNSAKAHARQKEHGLMSLVCFDMPWYAGENISRLTNMERRERLATVIDGIGSPQLTLSPLLDLTNENIEKVFAIGGEGLMAKNMGKGSEYEPGAKTNAWQKLKFQETADVVIMGFTEGKNKYAHLFGALIYGQYLDGKLTERGQVGGGFNDDLRIKMHENRDAYLGKVIEIAHMGIDKTAFRHPRMKIIRDDKLATECTWDEKAGEKTITAAKKPKKATGKTVTAKKKTVFDEQDAQKKSEMAFNFSGGSSKYFQVFVSFIDGQYEAWSAYGKYDQSTEEPTTRLTSPIAKCDDLDSAVAAANKKLKAKLGSGYRGAMIAT